MQKYRIEFHRMGYSLSRYGTHDYPLFKIEKEIGGTWIMIIDNLRADNAIEILNKILKTECVISCT
jgi:hypothetical protein